jgi:hypothetical protein
VQATVLLDKPAKGSTDLTLSLSERNCNELVEGCRFKDVCKDRSICHQTDVRNVLDKFCKAHCALLPSFRLFKKNPRGECEKQCPTVTETSVILLHNPHCDAFIAWDNQNGGRACTTADNFDKAICDAGHTLSKGVCDVQQEVRRFYENNPIAVLTTEVRPNVLINGTINRASVSADLKQLHVNATMTASGPLDVGLKYERKTATDLAFGPGFGWGLCTTNWAETTHVDVSIKSSSYDVKFAGTFEDDPSNESVLLKYSLAEPLIIKIDFSPSPMDAVFGKNPHLILNCPTAVIGTTLLGTAEAVLTKEDARKALPVLTGHNYPLELDEDTGFPIEIEKLIVCRTLSPDECDKNNFALVPTTSSHGLIFRAKK